MPVHESQLKHIGCVPQSSLNSGPTFLHRATAAEPNLPGGDSLPFLTQYSSNGLSTILQSKAMHLRPVDCDVKAPERHPINIPLSHNLRIKLSIDMYI